MYSAMDALYIQWRNERLQMWAKAVRTRRGKGLLALRDRLFTLLRDVDGAYTDRIEKETAISGDRKIMTISYALAALRWYNRLAVGREPNFETVVTPAILADWLAQPDGNTRQPSLFGPIEWRERENG